MKLDNCTVCITGGNKGLGQAIVKKLLVECKKIIVIDRSEQITFDDKIEYIRIDLNKERPEIREVDLFISNVGMSLGCKPFLEISEDEIDKMLNVNIKSHLWFYKNFKFKKFVFINSVLAYRGVENYSLYCASKAFVRTFFQSLLREGKDVMIVYPYKLNTQMFTEVKDFRTLDVKDVADKVVEGVKNDKREIWLPWLFRYTEFLYGIFPRFFINWVMNLMSRLIPVRNKKID